MYFFDSFGEQPIYYGEHIDNFLKEMTRDTKFPGEFESLSFPIQSPRSDLCGFYCVFIAYYLCKSYSLDFIINKFTTLQRDFNDSYILSWFCKNFYSIQFSPRCNIVKNGRN